ncbi:ankyrin repeat-containing domain protein [Aspergillus aurantiobrunneus]
MNTDDFVIVENPDELLSKGESQSNGETRTQNEVMTEDVAAIRSWLSPTEFDSDGSEYHKHLNTHAPGTGDWLVQAEAYQKWHDSTEATTGGLWIQGIPGSGKSVVAARVIQELTEKETALVIFFFARRIIKSNSHPQNLVRDCLYQLLDHSVALQVRLEDLRKQNSSIEYCPFQELWQAFLLGLSTLTRAYIVFDALDELAVEENDFLPLLLDLAQLSPPSIKLIITSRPVPHLLDVLRGPSLALIRLTRRAVESDIATYIEQRLSQQEERTLTDEQQAVIKETICRKAQGLFLYARLMLDQLMQQSTTPVDQHLQRLPESLEDMYVNLLNEHAARSGAGLPFQSWLLSWITHSTRPLRVTELAALALSTADRAGLNNDQDAKLMVRTACGPLLEILENETVQVIHHSFTEFLLDSHRPTASESSTNAWFPAFLSTATHRSLMLSIINYLLSGCFTGWGLDWDEYCGPGFEKQHQDLMLQFPFLQYAVHNLLEHAASCDIEDPELMQALDRLFDTKHDVFNAWKDFWFASMSDYGPDEFLPIHVAARAGLAHYTAHLIAKGEDPNVEDSTGQTPSGFAAMNGNSETLDVLLNSHASITDFDSDGLAPIHHAARGDHVDVLQRLLDAGADPLYPQDAGNRPRSSSPGKTPIEHACQRGNTNAAMLLLQHIDETKRRCVLPHWAAVKGQANTLRALLEYPEIRANVAVKDAAGNTALYLAACADSAATVDLLLRHGADVHARSSALKSKSSGRVRERWTALQAWANGHASSRKYYQTSVDEWEQVGELLIRAGSDFEARDDEGKTVIFYWSLHGTFGENDNAGARFVSLLLRHGANARALDSDGNSVLHECYSYYGTGAVMRLLVDAGADINHARKTDGVTPLIGAAKRQFEDIKMFTNRGADPNLQDWDGNTALHWICRSWVPGLATLRAWLQVADPTIRNNAGQTCIYNLEFGNRGHERVQAIPLFVEKGLDLESRDRRGRTALLGACENGEQHFITALLQHGACATATDFENKTCLHILGQVMLSSIDHGAKDRKISVDVMSRLIEAGANINAVDNHGNTAFHDAIAIDDYFRPVQVRLEALLELGAVPNTTDKHGRTVLHKIASLPGEPFADRFHWLQNAEISLDLHARDYQGFMPIHCAAAAGDVNVLKLAKAGADLQARVDNGRNVLHLAAGAGQGSALGLLCKLYSDSKLEINQRDEKGRTPLHYAAASGSSECVFYLLQAGADPNAQDRRGLTALHAATEYQINVDALRRRRRDAEFPYGEGRGPSYESIQRMMDLRRDSAVHKTPEAVRAAVAVEEEVQMIQDSVALLLSAGAKTGLCDSSGWTAYHLAVYLGRQEMAAVLESLPDGGGAQVSSASSRWYSLRSVYANQIVQQLNVGGCDHYTVLHSALSQRNEILVEALLDAGVDATVRGPDGLTPVHYVAFWGLVSVMKLMARYIEDLNAFNPPLLHAALCRKASNIQMVHLLISHGVNVNAHFQVPLDKNTWTAAASEYNAVHMLAAGEGWWHISALESLCKAGADIEATDSHGRTVLQCALTADNSVRHGAWQEDTLDIVLTHGANINAQLPKDGSTALQRALKFRWSRPIIERLLRHGADISLGDVPAIHAAVESRVVESCEAILNAGADLNTLCHRPSGRRRYFVRSEGPHIETPLLAAAMKSSYEYETRDLDKRTPVISFLLQQGADPLFELPGEGSTTTVFHEICHYHGIVSPFIEAGIDLETTNGDGLTPLLVSCSSPKTLKNSLRHESTPIELINAGANVHATDRHGSTALHLATRSGLCETVSLLIEKGASVSATNDAGLTPLYYAVDHGYTEKSLRLTKALLAAGADPLFTGPNGEGPLHILAASLMQFSPAGSHESNYQPRNELDYFAASKALYKTFTDAGCDPNARDNKGNTPLFPYVREVKEECEVFNSVPPAEEDVRDMFDTHDVFAVNDDGDTLLHAIASREEEERSEEDAVLLFRELLARGLDVRRENNKGLSALDVAMAYGKQAILELFEREE